MNDILVLLVGLFAGIISGLAGVGGGTIIVPGLVLLLGFSQHLAQGVSLAVIVPTALVGAYGYYRKGYVDLKVVSALAGGAILGAFLGAKTAVFIPGAQLRQIFGFFAIFISIRMMIGK